MPPSASRGHPRRSFRTDRCSPLDSARTLDDAGAGGARRFFAPFFAVRHTSLGSNLQRGAKPTMDESPADTGHGPSGNPPPYAPHGTGEAPAARRIARWRARWKSWLLVAAVVAAAAMLIMQRWNSHGATPATVAAKKALDDKKPEQRPTDPFTFGPFTLRPSDTVRIEAGIKPGHWTTASLEVRANFDDFRGDLAAEMVAPGGQGVDLDGLPFRMRCERPALLPKMQKKVLDIAMFAPVAHFSRQAAPRLLSRSGRDVWNARELITPIPAEQFFLVVLARQPDDYRYLHSLDSVWAPRGSVEDRGAQAHYRVHLPFVTVFAPLPSQALFWTNTAVLLWDGLDPDLLTPAQQQALVDWLHWGGQLIVSGPDSLEALRGSFLDGVLAAAPGETWEMTAETLSALARAAPDAPRPLRVTTPWSGLHLLLDQREAHVLAETAEHQPLVAERRVGRGRTVVTAFRLTQRELIDWPGYDAIFNAALLRRSSRRFVRSVEDKVGVAWADGIVQDATRVSQLRYFTRDAGHERINPPPDDQMPWQRGLAAAQVITSDDPFDVSGNQGGLATPIGSGVAGWDDQSLASRAARQALQEAAGITVPRGSFVFAMLGTYLLVLVPLNWLVFRWLGRVEMAWVAAPIVAAVFGLLVIRMAQLDIGFARSATEVSLLEVQGEYPRGHVTRYGLLYTSLATQYALEMASPTAVALPFATGTPIPARQNRSTVLLRQEPETGAAGEAPLRLSNLEVSSNSAGMIHTEEMYDLGGAIHCRPLGDRGRYRIRNGTMLRMHDVGVVTRKSGSPGDKTLTQVARLGTLEPGAEAEFSVAQGTDADSTSDQPPTGAAAEFGALNLQTLVDAAWFDTAEGELRLVAWTGDELPGLSITPVANQTRRGTVILAHLDYGPPTPIQMDFNTRARVAEGLPAETEPFDFVTPTDDNRP